jgi:putative redox protein
MAETVVVRQNHHFETEFWAADPHEPESTELEPVTRIHSLTPYGMLLASLGACTAIVVHTYAQHHGIELHEVKLVMEYNRNFAEDCEDCEEIDGFEEDIAVEIEFEGELTPAIRQRLLAVSKQCPIHLMLEEGIETRFHAAT